MKHCLIAFVVAGLIMPLSSTSQVLVNPDFEDTWNCPSWFDFETNIDSIMEGWFTTSQTPDGWHEGCPAMAPSSNTNVPNVYEGLGAAGLFSGIESFAQHLNQPLDPNCAYHFAFKAVGSHLGQTPPQNPPKCNYLCLYGTNTQPPIADPFSVGTPADELPGAILLGCSQNVWDTTWQAFDIDFVPAASFEYLIISMNPTPGCIAVEYVLIDDLELDKNCAVGVSQAQVRRVDISGGNGRIRLQSETTIKSITVFDLMGRTLLNVENVAADRFVSGVLHSHHVIVRVEFEHGGTLVKRVML